MEHQKRPLTCQLGACSPYPTKPHSAAAYKNVEYESVRSSHLHVCQVHAGHRLAELSLVAAAPEVEVLHDDKCAIAAKCAACATGNITEP